MDPLRVEPVRTGRHGLDLDLLLQPRNADLIELVEIAAKNAKEAQALQQRRVRMFSLGQHPAVELQQAEFPVEVKHFARRTRRRFGALLCYFHCDGLQESILRDQCRAFVHIGLVECCVSVFDMPAS